MSQPHAPMTCRTCGSQLQRDAKTGAIGCGSCRYEIESCQGCGRPPQADAAPWNIPAPYCTCSQPQIGRTLSPQDLSTDVYKR